MKTAIRTVRVFLSSTFRDFAEERDLLVRKVFPELRRKCRERQVDLIDVDLRWGITEEEAQQGNVLPICLAEIDRSRPFFMGFIGERYGWIPSNDQYASTLLTEQEWMRDHRGDKSVTELEMLHGVLNNPAMVHRAFFYFRDPNYSLQKGDAYRSEGPLEKVKLEALKNRIRLSGFPVLEDYSTPEILAERVKADLWRLIDESFPESEVPDALTREGMRHVAYATSRLGSYIGGEPYLAAINTAMSATARQPVLVTGASGGGKSALLANWAEQFSSANPSATVISHFLAAGAEAAQPVNIVVRILREIAQFTGEKLVLQGDPRKTLDLIGPWLEKAGAFATERGGMFVFLLDALEKMSLQNGMSWWPAILPEGVGLVVSCLPGEVFDAVFPRMDWKRVHVLPLKCGDCEKFIITHLGKYRKSLAAPLVQRILGHPISRNPLFLRTLLEELRVCGEHEELEKSIDHYLASQTVDGLFELVLDRVEIDNSRESVCSVLKVLWATKESVLENDLLDISGLPPAIWAHIRTALDDSLIGTDGYFAFSHDYLRKAVERRYLAGEEERRSIRRQMADFCVHAMSDGRKNISRYVRRHAVQHLVENEDWNNAVAVLSDLEFIESRAVAQELHALLTEYELAIASLPESEEERRTTIARQTELRRYAVALRDYAAAWSRIRDGNREAEPFLPHPLEAVRLSTREEIAVKNKRIIDTPDRLDKLKAFQLFVGKNFGPLHAHAALEGFVANLARNDAPAGPVHDEGKHRLEPLGCIKLVRRFAPEETYSPLQACQMILEGHTVAISSIALSPDGQFIVSGSLDYTLRVWNTDTGECTLLSEGHTGSVTSVALSADSLRVVSGAEDHTLRIWDARTGLCQKVLEGHIDAVESVALGADGRRVVSGSRDRTLRIWDAETGECIRLLEGHADSVACIALSADGRRVVSGGFDNTLRVWNAETGECIRVLEGHSDWIQGVAFSADGRCVLSGSRDKTLRVWDAKTGDCIKVLEGHTDYIESVAMSADGRRAVSGSGLAVYVWNIDTGECIRVLEGHSNSVESVTLSADGRRVVSGGYDDTLRVWDIQLGEYTNALQRNNDSVRCIAGSVDGRRIVSGNRDRTLRIWDAETGECIRVLEGHADSVACIALSADGQRVVSGGFDDALRVWNAETGECVRVLEGHSDWFHCVAWSADSLTVLSGSSDRTLRLWNAETGECIGDLGGHDDGVACIALSTDGLRIVSGSGKNLETWDRKTGRYRGVSDVDRYHITCFAFSPDGRRVVSGGADCCLRLWDASTWQCIRVLEGHTNYIESVAVSTDGRFIFSSSSDNSLRVWDAETGECLAVLFDRDVIWYSLALSRRRIAAGSHLGGLVFFEIENLPNGPDIITAQCKFLAQGVYRGPAKAHLPCCGRYIFVPQRIMDRIWFWETSCGEGGYTDPALMMNCPECGNQLRVNPFFFKA